MSAPTTRTTVATAAGPAGVPAGRQQKFPIYLAIYNLGSACAWFYVLFHLLQHLVLSHGDYSRSLGSCADALVKVQTMAILEIFHSALGIVKTPLSTTVIQVFSRLLLVWGVLVPFAVPEVRGHWAVSTMIAAWCVAEIVRYLYYAEALRGEGVPAFLTWCRYSFFFVLYPIGAGSEWILLIQSLDAVKKYNVFLYYAYVAIAFLYPPGLFVMYTHMMAQRRKVMRQARVKAD
ncbi:hypothetical protein HDU86_005172 [Geranomyces michiganensis]|nr:hypothetical protein HDU86_005172 [Geranomyces michiganensis]